MPVPGAGSFTFLFFFDRRPVEAATGGLASPLKGVSKESSAAFPVPGACGRPMPRGSDREKWFVGGCDGAEGAACGMPKTDDRGGAIGVSPCALEDAEEGVCACESGCGCALPKLPREGCGRPMRPASKTELRIGVCVGVVALPSELSSDILFLVLEAAAPGRAKSPS